MKKSQFKSPVPTPLQQQNDVFPTGIALVPHDWLTCRQNAL